VIDVRTVTAMRCIKIVRNVKEHCHNKPRGVQAQQSASIELPEQLTLAPREPQSYATEEEEHVNTYITTLVQGIEDVCLRHPYVEEYHEEHCRSHQLASIFT
jgi:hypothetical protein